MVIDKLICHPILTIYGGILCHEQHEWLFGMKRVFIM